MSHATSLLAIIDRERERKARIEAIREAKYAFLHAVIARAHASERRSAALIERSEALMLRITRA